MNYPVNDEQLVIDYLKGREDLAALVGDRISTQLPPDRECIFPLIVAFRVAGATRDHEYLDQPRIQIEAWTDSVVNLLDALNVMRVTRFAMSKLQIIGDHELGVVTDSVELAVQRLDDHVTGYPRYIADYTLRLHPYPSDSQSLT